MEDNCYIHEERNLPNSDVQNFVVRCYIEPKNGSLKWILTSSDWTQIYQKIDDSLELLHQIRSKDEIGRLHSFQINELWISLQMLPRSLINVDLNAKPNSHSHFLKVNIREGNGPREIKAEVKEEILCSEDTNYEPTSSTCFKTIQNTPVYKASSITFKEEIMEDEYVPESDDLKTISVYKASSIEKTKSSDSHETYDPQGKPGNNNDEEIPASPPYTYKPSVKLNQNKNDDYVPQATEASKEVGVSYRARAIMRGSQDEENISNEQLYSPKSTPADSTGVFKAKRNFFRYAPSAIDEPDVEEKPKTPDSNKRTTRSKAKVSKANSAASLVEVKAQILRNFELFGEDSDTEEVRQSDTQIKRQKINERGKSKDKTDKFEELKSERERRRLKSKTEDNREIAPTDTKPKWISKSTSNASTFHGSFSDFVNNVTSDRSTTKNTKEKSRTKSSSKKPLEAAKSNVCGTPPINNYFKRDDSKDEENVKFIAASTAVRNAKKDQDATEKKKKDQEKRAKEDIEFDELELMLNQKLEDTRIRKEFLHKLTVLKLDHLTNAEIVNHVIDFTIEMKKMFDYYRNTLQIVNTREYNVVDLTCSAELFTEAQLMFAMQQIEIACLDLEETGMFTEVLTENVLPEFILEVFTAEHNVTRKEAIQRVRDQVDRENMLNPVTSL